MKKLKNTFESLTDILSWKTHNISIDYKKKKILYNMDCYGNSTLRKIESELETLKSIDSRFEKIIYVSAGMVEHYFTSPTYHEQILKLFNEKVFGVYPVYTGKNPGRSSEKDDEFMPVTREMIGHVQDVKKEKQKIERFYRDMRKLSYVPHVKLKHFQLEKLEKREIYCNEALAMIKNGQAAADIGKFFKPKSKAALDYSNDEKMNRASLDEIEALESIGFKFMGKKYTALKASRVFKSLGTDEETA